MLGRAGTGADAADMVAGAVGVLKALINWRALSRPAILTVGGAVRVVGMDVVGDVAVGSRPRKFVLLPIRRCISEKVFKILHQFL